MADSLPEPIRETSCGCMMRQPVKCWLIWNLQIRTWSPQSLSTRTVLGSLSAKDTRPLEFGICKSFEQISLQWDSTGRSLLIPQFHKKTHWSEICSNDLQ